LIKKEILNVEGILVGRGAQENAGQVITKTYLGVWGKMYENLLLLTRRVYHKN